MKLSISVQDFVKAQTMEPGWRKAKIKEVTREQNAAKTGMNTVILFEINNGALPNGGGDDLREMKQWMPDSYMANWLPLLEAIYDKSYTMEDFAGLDFDPMTFLGVEVWVEISREAQIDKNTKKDTGRLQNNIRGYMNIDKSPL